MWIQTKAEKNMPCDPELICYRIPKEGKGTEKIVTQNGMVVSADRVLSNEAGGIGYIPHFATCGKEREKIYENRRKERTSKAKVGKTRDTKWRI